VTTYNEIIKETSNQVTLFLPQPTFIKERIEYLIEKEIIKRKTDNFNCFEYTA
jgi:hypothetical protein